MANVDIPANPPPPPPPPTSAGGRNNAKGNKGVTDSNDAAKQLQAKIAQLELDQRGRTEEDAEIDREVRKANRDLQSMLSSMDPSISKVDALQKKYSELLSDMKRTEREHIKAKKRGDQLQKEKDSQRSEFTKANTMKDKLEKLSRELTKENKKLKEDLRDMKERETEQKDSVHRQIEHIVEEVESLVLGDRKQPELSPLDIDRDKMFREKFKSFVEQYELREIHFHSILRTRELEIQYHMAQHEKLRKAQDAELKNSHQLTRQVSTFSQTENELRNQLNIYVEKFKQVEDTLNNSNDLFLTFRKEMEEMSKKTKRLEKENMQLTRKQEATNRNIFQMAEERTTNLKDIGKMKRENEKLKNLCRAMQTNGYAPASANASMDQTTSPAQAGADDLSLLSGDEDEEAIRDGEDDEDDEEDDENEDDDDDDDDRSIETDSKYEDSFDRPRHIVESSETALGDHDDDTDEDDTQVQTHKQVHQVQQQQQRVVASKPRTFGPMPPPAPPTPASHLAAVEAAMQRHAANGLNGKH